MKNLNPLFDYLSTIKKIQDSVRINIPQINLPNIQLLNNIAKLHEQLTPQIDFGVNIQQQIASIPFPQIELSRELTDKINLIKNINIPNVLSLYGGEYSRIEKIQKYLSTTVDFCTQLGLQYYDEEQVENELASIIEIFPQKEPNQITREDIRAINTALRNSDVRAFWYFIIPIIITLIIAYSTNKPSQQIISNVVFTQINTTIYPEKREVISEFSKTLEILCLEQRKAKISTFVRTKPSLKSSIISAIDEGQIVFVQQIQHKWIYIIYQDSDYMIKSGWTLKKQFEKE